jgi:hypothetical protein
MFDSFSVPRSAMLSRFCSVQLNSSSGGSSKPTAEYTLNLPSGAKRMLDLLISRLLTGRIVLSEATVGYASALVRRSWACVDHLGSVPTSDAPQGGGVCFVGMACWQGMSLYRVRSG